MISSELFKFACKCLLLDEHPELKEGIKEKFVSGEVDLDRFVYLCSNHLILPTIYLRLKEAGLMDVFPDEYADHLKEIYKLNKKRNEEILAQIYEISKQLAKENIKPLYLKGTANLMDNLYSYLGERMIGDIDFLVQEKDYLKSIELVKRMGYQSNSIFFYDDPKTFKHYPRLFRKDVPADIEIHRVPVNIQFSKQFKTELLFQNKKAIKNRSNCFVSSNEHKLIHTFIHSQFSNKGYQFKQIGLRDLYDFYLLSKKIMWNEVKPQIEEKKKAQTFFDYSKYLSLPEDFIAHLKTKPPNQYGVHHIWFLDNPRPHHIFIFIIKISDVFIKRPFLKIKNAIFKKSARKSLFRRLKDPKWYKIIYNGIISIFSS